MMDLMEASSGMYFTLKYLDLQVFLWSVGLPSLIYDVGASE